MAKVQVTIPARLRERIGVRVGDLMETTVVEDGLLLRPKAVVDRDAVADRLERILHTAPIDPRDKSKAEQDILEDAIADVAAARRRE